MFEKDNPTGSPALEAVLKTANESYLKRFAAVLSVLKTHIASQSHTNWIHTQKVFQLENYISFANGRAEVKAETIETMKEDFKTYIESPEQEKAFSLLSDMAALTDKILKLQKDKNLIPFSLDWNWFTENVKGEIVPNPEIIKYC